MNRELPDVQLGCGKGRGTRDQIVNVHWIIEKAKSSRKTSILLFDYAKTFDCVNHNKLWKILQELGIPDHLTCLLRNLYAGQEATVRTGHGTTVQFNRSVVSNSLRPHGLQHARPPCPSPTSGVHSNLHPFSQ